MNISFVFFAVLTLVSASKDKGLSIPLTRNDVFGGYHVDLEGYHQRQSTILRQKYHPDPNIRDGSMPLTNYQDVQYYGLVDVGSPSQTMRVLVDTGSADMWVMSTSCHIWNPGCWFHNKYDHSKSSTYQADGRSFSITYVSGSASGHLSRENITLGSVTVYNQTFAEVDHPNWMMLFAQFDGILGLAFPSIAVSKENPPVVNMIKQKAIAKPFFSLDLTYNQGLGEGGQLTFGFTNRSRCNGSFTFVSVIKPAKFWSFILDGVTVGGQDVGWNNVTAIVDSGTSLIGGSADLIQPLNDAIGAKKQGDGLYTVDCKTVDSLPPIIFNVNDLQIIITSKDYIKEVKRFGIFKVCVSGFMDIDFGIPLVVLGDIFIQKTCTQFNHGHGIIGFAQKAE